MALFPTSFIEFGANEKHSHPEHKAHEDRGQVCLTSCYMPGLKQCLPHATLSIGCIHKEKSERKIVYCLDNG